MKFCEFTMPEVRYYLSEANFTEDERAVFENMAKGRTADETAELCNISLSTVKRVKARIWAKIDRLKGA